MKKIRHTETRRIVEWAMKLGFVVAHSERHGKLFAPGGVGIVVFGYTPSDHRAVENLRHQIVRSARQAGLTV